ncbi:MAG: hypothetical protein GY845_13915 [Planctomycetes bacterium]|nr:hypothetical protein [Planctomycetota bacterium]
MKCSLVGPIFLSFIFVLVFAGNAQASVYRCFAYIDPGVGSLILQVLISSFVAIVFGVKVFGRSIKEFISNKFLKTEKDKQNDE